MARGGFREGAGRPSGSTSKSSPQQSKRISEIAKANTEEGAIIDLPPLLVTLTADDDAQKSQGA